MNASIVATIIDDDRRLTLGEIAREANLSKMTVQRIMKDMLQKKKLCARNVRDA
jgi:DNA-binding IclR family transcriptional regulator